MKSWVFKVVVEDDEHEDGRRAFRAYCPALESIGASTWGATHQNHYDLRAEKGNSTWDIRHRNVNSYSYELPFGSQKTFLSGVSGLANAIVSGWQISGITTFSTGQSFTPRVFLAFQVTLRG